MNFTDLIKDQFTYGGQKYALSNEKESTDMLFDRHGKNWLFGTMDKYTYRYKNLARERDILKIATYCYILWLKRGFFIKREGLSVDVIDTTVDVKLANFDKFIEIAERYKPGGGFSASNLDFHPAQDIDSLSDIFATWSKSEWGNIYQASIFDAFWLARNIWEREYKNVKEHDKDTYNES